MKALHNFVSASILTNVPAIKTCRMWNEQIHHNSELFDKNMETKNDEKFYKRPACFIEYIYGDVKNFSIGIRSVELVLRFRFQLESMKFERLANLDFCDTFDAWVSGLRGLSTDPVQFTTLQEILTQLDTDFTNVNAPYMDYITSWRRTSGNQRTTDITKTTPTVPHVTIVKSTGLPLP